MKETLMRARQETGMSNFRRNDPMKKKCDSLSVVYLCTLILPLVGATSLLNQGNFQTESLYEDDNDLTYGVDVSFPMHHMPFNEQCISCQPENNNQQDEFRTPLDQFTQRRLDFYKNHFLQGCITEYGEENCVHSERERIEMAKRQPKSMKNMTQGLGFKKLKLPETAFQAVLNFWITNQHEAYTEYWPEGSTYVNHWESSPAVVRVDNHTLGGGDELTSQVWDSLRPILSEWTGQHLTEASMYGIRIYKAGSVLATHVDRNPLVTSAIINVDQDVDEPWPLEVIGHDGKAHNVTMEPGDLVLYESHSILHGRPYPLQGRFMANLFVHFEPTNPNALLSDPPLYRRPMQQSKRKCVPTLKNGNIVCLFE